MLGCKQIAKAGQALVRGLERRPSSSALHDRRSCQTPDSFFARNRGRKVGMISYYIFINTQCYLGRNDVNAEEVHKRCLDVNEEEVHWCE